MMPNTKTNVMTTTTLISKLNKMNIAHTILDCNGYNMDIEFTINNKKFKAGYFKGETEIQDFCREIVFDVTEQEMRRRFFKNFNSLLKYAAL
jgi:hypothetical protein